MTARHVLIAIVLVLAACKRGGHHDHELAKLANDCNRSGDLGCPRTILYVHDLAASQRYYRDQLGFHIDWTDGDPADFGAVSRGDTQLFMCERCQGHPGSWLWIHAPDVDRMYAELAKRGAIIKAPPENKPWGVREMQVADPDGNVLRIGSSLREE